MSELRGRSFWTLKRPMIRCTASRRGGSSTAITIATVICRSTYSAAAICWSPSCGAPTWTRRRARSRRWHASSPASAPAGRGHAFCCAPTAASRGRTSWPGARPTASISCSGWRRTSGSSPRSRPSLILAPPRAGARGRRERRFKTFLWATRRTWSRRRRVVAKAEWTKGEANPRFVVTSLRRDECKAKYLYEKVYCARGDMENRIKECQLDLYADRTSAATMRANQLRLWFYSMAYVLLCALRRIGLHDTEFAQATCGTIRLKLLKIGALVRISVRRIKIAMASACPAAQVWGLAAIRLAAAAKARASPARHAPPRRDPCAAQPTSPRRSRKT